VVYSYQQQLAELAQSGAVVPFKQRIGPDSDEILWVSAHRGLVLGLRDRILRTTAPPNLGAFRLEQVQTYNGAGSSITATGEYNLFYVGADGVSVYGLIYDGNTQDGLRAINLSMWGGRNGKVTGMFWNSKKNCLYVSREGLKGYDVLFLDTEYEVRGWGVYDTELEGVGEFRGGVFLDGPLFFDVDGNAYFERSDFADGSDGGTGVDSDVEFFKNVPRSEEGITGHEYFSVGKTNLIARNCSEVKVRYDHQEDVPFNTQNVVAHKFRHKGLSEFRDLQQYVQEQHSILPILRLRHSKDEGAEILSTSSMINIARDF